MKGKVGGARGSEGHEGCVEHVALGMSVYLFGMCILLLVLTSFVCRGSGSTWAAYILVSSFHQMRV